MIKKIFSLVLAIQMVAISVAMADEGMWIPLLLSKYNIKDMKAKGFKLTADDIYSINHASMKDAVVIYGRGCTAELISDQGLIITNHHCGYGSIQSHSSLEHDYLTDGFWAMSKEQELTNQNLTVTFLERMEDVTKQVLVNINNKMSESERQSEIQKQIQIIESKASDNGKYKVSVKPFYYGNEFYLFVTKVYTDVRLVGAPPSGIGKFGGDTDNWEWPRHTGDFSLFRIYADKNNEPADFSSSNVPYHPKMHFPISLKGVKKGDFTMVFGYPGSTTEYLTSFGVKMISEIQNPARIKIRQGIIDIMSKYMNEDAGVRIQYANKYAGVSNYWKKWMGENKGLKRLDAIGKKKEFEEKISKWIDSKKSRKEKYGKLLNEYKKIYEQLETNQLAYEYFYEAIYRLEILRFASGYRIFTEFGPQSKKEDIEFQKERFKKSLDNYFKDYYLPLDKELFNKMISLYYKNVDPKFLPEELKKIEQDYKGDISKYIENIYNNTIFNDKSKIIKFLNEFNISSVEKLKNDPLYRLGDSFIEIYSSKLLSPLEKAELQLDSLNRIWMQAILEYEKGKQLYPDANFTLRVTYGKVDDYSPSDGVEYQYYTTLKGIIEKDNPNIYDYKVPAKLKELFDKKDYGEYAENGEMHVAFIASNHTTGGNSGSPVINAEGQLIGVNFDRNWEGTMSDIMYDPDMCRNISLDIRYALFIIDKVAGASHLIQEMTLIR